MFSKSLRVSVLHVLLIRPGIWRLALQIILLGNWKSFTLSSPTPTKIMSILLTDLVCVSCWSSNFTHLII
jgi:hypothetical protein